MENSCTVGGSIICVVYKNVHCINSKFRKKTLYFILTMILITFCLFFTYTLVKSLKCNKTLKNNKAIWHEPLGKTKFELFVEISLSKWSSPSVYCCNIASSTFVFINGTVYSYLGQTVSYSIWEKKKIEPKLREKYLL